MVTQIIVVHNNELLVDGIEQEAKGIEFCQNLLGGTWIQTSYNGTFRKNFAGIGFIYDAQRDAFIEPQPQSEGWVLDEATCTWRNAELEAEACRMAGSERIQPYYHLSLIDVYSQKFGIDPDVTYEKGFITVTNFLGLWKEQDEFRKRLETVWKDLTAKPSEAGN